MIAIYKCGNKSGLVYSYEELYKETFSPMDTALLILDGAHGETYKERQASIEEQAIDYHDWEYGGLELSWDEYATITAYFARYGKRYGLLTVFKENAIC